MIEQHKSYDELSGSLVGCTGDTIDDKFDLYCQHSGAVGFSIRRSTQRRTLCEDKKVTKKYLCSCAWFNEGVNANKVKLTWEI